MIFWQALLDFAGGFDFFLYFGVFPTSQKGAVAHFFVKNSQGLPGTGVQCKKFCVKFNVMPQVPEEENLQAP